MNLLEPFQVLRPSPKDMYLADAVLFSHEFSKNFPAVRLLSFRNSWILGEGYVVPPWSLVPISEWFNERQYDLVHQFKTVVKVLLSRNLSRTVIEVPEALVITDEFSNSYFHWLADCLPRLWLVRKNWHNSLLVLPRHLQAWPIVRDSLNLMGANQFMFLRPGEKAKAHKVLLPERIAPTGNFHPAVMRQLREHLIKAAGVPKVQNRRRRFYISRNKARGRRLRNEHEAEPVFSKYGFETVFLEEKNFQEQICLLAQAEVVVAVHGAGLTNVLFMNPGSAVLELRHSGDAHNNCYFSLAGALELNYYYLHCPPAVPGENMRTADLVADLEKLDFILGKMVGSI